MTRPSSSLSTQPLDKPLLLDASGRPVPLGETVGAGGEGTVYALDGRPELVAKVYHKAHLGEVQDRKLRKLVSLATSEVLAISAWPRALLFDPTTGGVRGLVMPRVSDAHPLHELYGTTTRARKFPHAQWGHLVLAARNLAAAFGTLHERGVVIGDVNQGNLMVDANMCVRLIDCDSFQITHRKYVFRCPVGTPHFTPPELQSQKLIEVTRTPHHDAFGLAILIFHLLFVGRHPFAGRFRGEGEMTIERAIAERRFAFSKHTAQTLVEPPPASLRLEDLPGSIGDLFERTFRAEGETPERPTCAEWVEGLEGVLKQRKACQFDDSHFFSHASLDCPWCRIENAGGPSFFLNFAVADGSSESRLAALAAQIERIETIHFPEIPATALKLPRLPMALKTSQKPKRGAADWLAAGWIASAAACVGGAFYWPALAAAAAGSIGTAAALAFGRAGRTRRAALENADAHLNERLRGLAGEADAVRAAHTTRADEYDAYAANVTTGVERFRSDTEEMHTILRQVRIEQRDDYLRGYAVCDYRRRIPGLTGQGIALLESYGIDSAYQVNKHMLTGVPSLNPSLMIELLNWRDKIEEKFEFKPEAGLTERELNADRQEATRRFKISLARKILQGAKRLRATSFAAQGQLDQELKRFQRHVDDWRALANQRQREQADRAPWERALNRSVPVLIGAGLGAPMLGLLGWLLTW